jgi:hypothetical protein
MARREEMHHHQLSDFNDDHLKHGVACLQGAQGASPLLHRKACFQNSVNLCDFDEERTAKLCNR